MTWAATDVRFIREAKGTSSDAKVLFVAVRLYCAERETDGAFSAGQLIALAEEAEVTTDPMKIAVAWAERGVWRQTSEGWLDVGFSDINPSHADREKERQRLRDYRRRQKQEAAERTGSRTPYAYTPTGQDRTEHDTPDALTGRAPKRGDGEEATQGREALSVGSSQSSSAARDDIDLIDDELAHNRRQAARERRDLLARAKLHQLSRTRVKGL